MQERLQKIIARAGIASRRHAEQLILSGQVRVNGQVVRELGTKADAAEDRIGGAGRTGTGNGGGGAHGDGGGAAGSFDPEQAAGSGRVDGGSGRAQDAAELFARFAGAG